MVVIGPSRVIRINICRCTLTDKMYSSKWSDEPVEGSMCCQNGVQSSSCPVIGFKSRSSCHRRGLAFPGDGKKEAVIIKDIRGRNGAVGEKCTVRRLFGCEKGTHVVEGRIEAENQGDTGDAEAKLSDPAVVKENA
jgi:hypothetical protein